MFLRLKSFITRKISDSLVNEIRAKHVNELKRLALKYENEKANIEKLNEHRIKHLNREREETIEKLILDNRIDLSESTLSGSIFTPQNLLPIIRRPYPNLMANNWVSVQPMGMGDYWEVSGRRDFEFN